MHITSWVRRQFLTLFFFIKWPSLPENQRLSGTLTCMQPVSSILKEQTDFYFKKMLASTSLIKAALSVYIFSQEENTNGRKLSA
jgi:hypothetical protein